MLAIDNLLSSGRPNVNQIRVAPFSPCGTIDYETRLLTIVCLPLASLRRIQSGPLKRTMEIRYSSHGQAIVEDCYNISGISAPEIMDEKPSTDAAISGARII